LSNESTSPQNWQQKYTKNKPLRKAKETVYAGISVKWFYITGFFAIVSVFAAFPILIIHNTVFQCFNIALIAFWWVIYGVYFRTTECYDETMLILRFIFDEYLGKHQVCKFDIPLAELQSFIPIVAVLANGLIKFTKNKYGVLIDVDWHNTADEEMERHLISIQAIINRLSGDMMIKFIASSRFGTPSPLLKKMEKKMSDPNTCKTDFKLFMSQYERIKNGRVTPDWDFKLFLGLGTCTTLKEAEDRLLDELSGIMDALEDMKVPANVIVDRNEIAKHYIQFMIPRDLL
jgi:hypothetical protein